MSNNWGQNKPPIGSTVNWSHPLSKGLVGAWLMNEGAGNRINDLSKNKNNLINTNANWITTNKNKSLNFNGIDSVLISEKTSNTGINFSTEFSLLAVYKGIASGTGFNLGRNNPDTSGNFIWSLPNIGGKQSFTIRNVVDIVDTGSIVSGNYFSTFIITHYSNLYNFYIDGILNSSVIDNNNISNFTSKLMFGAFGAYGIYSVGILNIVEFFNYRLSNYEIKELSINPYQFIYKPSRRIYYLAPTGGWTHNINGISNANIGKIAGVSLEDIAAVNGVS